MRTKITLACTECKQRNYNTMKNKKNTPDRIEMNKYCRFCGKYIKINNTNWQDRLFTANHIGSGDERHFDGDAEKGIEIIRGRRYCTSESSRRFR